MWFGTPSGLNRYDGYQFKLYAHDPQDPNSLSDNRVIAMLEDSHGQFWVGAYEGGLNLFDRKRNRFTRFRNDPENPYSLKGNTVRALLETRDGRLWIGSDKGLAWFDHEQGRFFSPEVSTEDAREGLSGFIRSLFEDAAGMLWVGTDKQGLVRYDRGSQTITRYRHDPKNTRGIIANCVNVVKQDADGAIWVGTTKGLQRFDRETNRFLLYQHDPEDPRSLAHNHVIDLWARPNGDLWVGSNGGGLHLLEKNRPGFLRIQRDPSNPNSLSGDEILSLYEDATGLLWVGVRRGSLNKGNPIAWRFENNRTLSTALSQPSIISIQEDSGQNLWIGTLGNGLQRWNPQTKELANFNHDPESPDSLSGNNVYCVFDDEDRHLWLGTSGGLNRLHRTSHHIEAWRHNPRDSASISSAHVFSILKDAETGRLWLGTAGGLDHFDPVSGKATRYQLTPDAPAGSGFNRIWHMTRGRNGLLWLATYQEGLVCMDPNAPGDFKSYRHSADRADSLSHDRVWHLWEDADGALWAGTAGGLNRFDPASETFISYGEQHGLPSGVVTGIQGDDAGFLWVSTPKGLARFDPRAGKASTYDRHHGALHEEFIPRACFRNRAGKMFFGAVSGLVSFFPERIESDPHPPRLALTDFRLFGESVSPNAGAEQGLRNPISETQSLTLSHRHDTISLEFAALHYAAPERNRYAYMMEGVDADWIYTDASRRVAAYTRLAHGAYRFRVKAGNRDGVWNEEGAALDIRILPPPWLTWWAKTLYLLALAALFGLIAHFIASRKKLAVQRALNARLQRFDKLKDHFLANVSHELRTPLHGMIGLAEGLIETSGGKGPKATNGLNMIIQCGRRLATMVDNFLDVSLIKNESLALQRKPVDLHSVVEVVLSLLGASAEAKGLKLVNAVRSDLAPVDADEDRVCQILYNLAGNAVKYTPSGSVRVSAEPDGDFIRIVVADTGPGLNPEEVDGLFEPFERGASTAADHKGAGLGLALTRDLVELHGGRLEVDSVPGKGCAFAFTLPPAGNRVKDVQNHLAPLAALEVEEPLQTPSSPSPSQNGYRLLAVDDERVNQTVIANLLQPHGYEVATADSGAQALALLDGDGPFDLVLLDIMMPGMSGYEVCRRIRERLSARELPVLFLSAKSQDADLTSGFEAGGNDYLPKPVRKGELLARIALHLDLLESHRALEAKVAERTRAVRAMHEERTRFFTNISHEIRTPLTLIKGPLQGLLRRGRRDDGPTPHALQRMARHVDRLARLVDQLLDIARLDDGKVPVEARRADIVAFVAACVDAFAEPAAQKEIELVLDQSLSRFDLAFDKDIVEKVLFNLLANALKHTGKHGKVFVKVEEDRNGAAITIRDTGKGIAQDQLDRIFDRFYRVRQNGTPGFGLGLALSQQLARLHGGSISAASEVGFGSEFKAYFPDRASATGSATETGGMPALTAADFIGQTEPPTSLSAETVLPAETPSVLVVDDHGDMRAYIREILSSQYRVREAEDGRQGLEAALEDRPSLIISDVMMPGLDGFELCRRLKENPDTKHTPIILLTVKKDAGHRIQGLTRGADDYLAKPFEAEELTLRVKNLVQGRQEMRRRFSRQIILEPAHTPIVSEDEAFLIRAKEIVEAQLGDPRFGVHELAYEVGLSERQLRRRFKELLHQGPAVFIREFRLKFAARLLAEKAGPVSQIAYRAGFRKPRRFSDLFREYFGVCPSQYAERPESRDAIAESQAPT